MMNVGELIAYATYFGMAFGAAFALVLGLLVLLQLERRFGHLFVPVLLPLVAIGITLGTVLSNRNLRFAALDIESIGAGAGGGGGWALRLTSLAIVGFSGAKVASHLLKRDRRPMPAGFALFISFIAYFIGNVVLNSAFGTQPAFLHNSVYPLVVFAAVYFARGEPLEPLIRLTKYALLSMMLLSLALAVAKPDLAVQSNYKGWIPGVTIRLWGVGSNANSIGPLALLTLLVEVMLPSRKLWFRLIVFLSALAVFLLAQSKTVWTAAAVCAPILAWYRFGRLDRGGTDVRFILGMLLILLIGGSALAYLDIAKVWAKIAASNAGADISTLTGRAQIWAAAIDEWKANPVFGYGIEAWGPEHRMRLGMQSAFSAHNQFLHALSSAGALGLGAFIVYLFFLGKGALRFAARTGGASLALLVTILLRCITEAPLAFGTILNGDFLTHVLLFAIALRGLGHHAKPAGTTRHVSIAPTGRGEVALQ